MNPHHQETIWLTDHPVAATERHVGPPLEPYAGIARKAQGHRGTLWTCEMYWKTEQDSQDRSTDRAGAPRHVMITVTPDMINTARPNTIVKAHPSYVAI